MLVQHHVTFQRHRVTGQYKGQCTCGWFWIGDSADEVTAKAAAHDLEWEVVEIRERADVEPRPLQVGDRVKRNDCGIEAAPCDLLGIAGNWAWCLALGTRRPFSIELRVLDRIPGTCGND